VKTSTVVTEVEVVDIVAEWEVVEQILGGGDVMIETLTTVEEAGLHDLLPASEIM
jgi:hypothetical protein